MKRLLKWIVGRGTEGALAMVLVLFFFVLLMVLLSFVLPQGSSLRSLMLAGNLDSLDPVGAGRHLEIDAGDAADTGSTRISMFARLQDLARNVKDRPAGKISWEDSHTGTPLGGGHAVQTFGRSGATIHFDDQSRLQLGENSLIVLRDYHRTTATGRRQVSLAILGGEFHATVAADGGESLAVDAQIPGGRARVISEQTGQPVAFKVVTLPDGSSILNVHSGSAQVTSAGRTVTIAANQAIAVSSAHPLGAPVQLPSAPALEGPPAGESYFFHKLPPQVRFSWGKQPGADAYHLAVSRDQLFEDVVYETRTDKATFMHGNLAAGSYYWRVAAISGSFEGIPSTTAAFRLIADEVPPDLQVEFPGPIVTRDRLHLSGQTEPGAAVFVASNAAAINDAGRFDYDLALELGLNVIVVEAVDAAGNIAQASRIVHARF